ncbi:MAG: sugar transferase [Clostridia bacterium]|nr:sugar transferase [Clostridia bacterium]
MSDKLSRPGYREILRRAESFFEILILTLEFYLIWRHYYSTRHFPHYGSMGKYVLMMVYAVLLIFVFYLCDSLKFGQLKFSDVFVSQVISILMVNFITYFQLCLISNRLISIPPMLFLTLLDVVCCFGLSFLYSSLYHKLFSPRNMVMIYGNENAVSLKFKMDRRQDKYAVNTLLSIEEDGEYIKSVIDKHDAVIINDVPAEKRNDILKYCFGKNIRTYVVPKISDILTKGAHDITLFDTPLMLIKRGGLNPTQRLVKRIFDVILSLIAIIVSSPVMLLIAIAIKAEDGGPVFYKQERVTIDERKFNIIKFRSMIVNAEAQGLSIPAKGHDPRITKVGSVIRPLRLDELPQIFNILVGNMSIVGPRPERTEHVEKYTAEIPEFTYRHKVKGGLTGYAQIFGKYNTTAYDKLRLDLMYIENYSLLLDIKLIVMTARILFKKESTEGFEVQEDIENWKKQLKEKNNKSGE